MDRRQRIISDLAGAPARVEPETASALEATADALHAGVASYCACAYAPQSLSEFAEMNPRTTFDRVAEMLRIHTETVDWLDASTLALWCEATATILLSRSLRSTERALMLTHELAHERRRRAPHREVLYLTLALLLPRYLLEKIPTGRVVTGFGLQRVCPWPVPFELCEARAAALRRSEFDD
ncbi:MAG: hypothetical protein Q8Q09_10640 [Deltaproteobacteria bacterium]|nr:hypothetical protein [Deltaproteobacteria bacterium]